MEGLLIIILTLGSISGWGITMAWLKREFNADIGFDEGFALCFFTIFWFIAIPILFFSGDYRPSKHGFLLWPEKRTMAGRDEQREALRGQQMAGLFAQIGISSQQFGLATAVANNPWPNAALSTPTRTPDEILNGAIERAQKRIKDYREAVKGEAEYIRTYQAALVDGEIPIKMIDAETNTEVRRVLLEKYGFERYMNEAGYAIIARDAYGELIERGTRRDERMRAVRVQNSSPEPDGTFKHYILRVPTHMRTPKQAIAWTFGLAEHEYDPDIMT